MVQHGVALDLPLLTNYHMRYRFPASEICMYFIFEYNMKSDDVSIEE